MNSFENTKIMLAPMAGYTDRAMRLVCHECGADYSVTEMVSARAVMHNDEKTFRLARIEADEGPVAIQIFGNDPYIMARAAEVLSRPKEGEVPVAIDINMGCPVNKIFSNGEGSALMRDPSLIGKIVSAVVGAVDIPVTVKMRAGVDSGNINAVECAIVAAEAGASMICVHGRTRVQMYGGTADREIIAKVKNSVHIPVFANGDVQSGEEAIAMLSETGADGIAVGRGAVGNPFLFGEIRAALRGEDYKKPTPDEICDTALRQLRLAIENKGERVAVCESRKQVALYLRSVRGAAAIRCKMNRAETYEDALEVMEDVRVALSEKGVISKK